MTPEEAREVGYLIYVLGHQNWYTVMHRDNFPRATGATCAEAGASGWCSRAQKLMRLCQSVW